MTVDQTTPGPALTPGLTSERSVLGVAARAALRRQHATARTTRVWRLLADDLATQLAAGISPDELAGILGVDRAQVHQLRRRYASPGTGNGPLALTALTPGRVRHREPASHDPGSCQLTSSRYNTEPTSGMRGTPHPR